MARRKGILFKELFLEHFVPHNYDKRSLKDDVQKYDLRLKARFGEMAIAFIQPFDLTSFLRDLRVLHKLSPASINRYLALVKATFRFAVQNDFIAKSPAQYLKPLLESNVRSRTLGEDERGRFVAACNEESGQAGRLLLLLVITGARLGEALGAKVTDIDLPGRTWFLPMTKAGKADRIFLSTATVALLREIIGNRRSGFLFLGKEGSKPMTRPAKAFARICARAGIENFRIHDLRRTWATAAINNGVPLHTVATALRHASPHITAKRYAFLQDKELIHAHEVVGQLMCGSFSQACL
jgi:integrase